jgi:hypothetical protein
VHHEPLEREEAGVTTCNRCPDDAIGSLNGEPLCRRHIAEVHAAIVKRAEDELDRRAAEYERQIPPAVLRDHEFGPAVWLLSAPFVADRAWRYVHLDRHEVDWEDLLRVSRPWSTTERLFVELAFNLWANSTSKQVEEMSAFNPYAWGAQLDTWNLRRLLEALAISGGKRVLVFDPAPLQDSSAGGEVRDVR